MSVKSLIQDGGGRGTKAIVEDQALLVSMYSCPPLIPQKTKIFSQFFTDDGTAVGSEDLGVDGTTSIDYWIPADDDNDRYITKLNFIVGYNASAYLWDFADGGAALTNGVKVFYTDTHGDEVIICNLKRNSSFLRCALSDGIIPTAWELRNLGATNDYGYLCSMDLTKMMPLGVKLDRGTNQRMSITIRDSCTDAETFNCETFGFERFE